MNHTQKKYAMERVDGIASAKIEAIEEAMPTTPHKILTYRKAEKLIKEGKVKMIASPSKEIHCYRNFVDTFDFSKHHDYNRRTPNYDPKAFKKKADVVRKERTRIKDKIMLGDAEEALKMIEAFTKM